MPSKRPASPALYVVAALLSIAGFPPSETHATPSTDTALNNSPTKPPIDVLTRLQALQSEGLLKSEAIPILEVLLSDKTDLAGLIAQSQNRIRDTEASSQMAYELAYRLMRLYEKSGQRSKAQTLGLRIARGDKPFGVRPDSRSSSRNNNGIPEWGNAALAIAIQLAGDKQQQQALSKALQSSQWVGARAQIERRLNGPSSRPVTSAFGWANLPRGVRLLASNQNVLSICHDQWRVFVGHPWGIAIYSHDGRPVTRVAIGTAALSMTVCNGALWAGTANGLVRVDLKTWAVSLLPGDQDLKPWEKEEQLRDFNNGVVTVAARGDVIWIGTRRDVRTFNTRTGALRIFSQEELKVNSHNEWSRFLFDGSYVWVDNDEEGCRRYDTRTGLWQTPVSPGSQLTLLGLSDGKLWGNVWVNDQLRNRVALIDRRTLHVSWIPLDGKFANELINQPFSLSGTFRGRPTFDGTHRFYFAPPSGHLKPVPQSAGEQRFFVARRPANLPTDTATWLNPAGDFDEQNNTYASIACLPGGARVIGARSTRTRYQYPNEDWPFDTMPSETDDTQGGLTLRSPNGKSRSLSGSRRADCLMGDEVFFALKDATKSKDNRVWLGTQKGLTLLDSDARVVNTWTRRDGLISDRVVSGTFLQGKLYLGTAWWDGGGGLAIYDPSTSVFTTRLSQDGLSTDKLSNVRTQGQRLQLSYGVQYRRSSDYRYQQYPFNYYSPSSDTFTPTGPPVIMSQNDANVASARTPSIFQNVSVGSEFPVHSPMPFLGGFVISTTRIGSRTFVCGTRGVMILEGKKVPFRLSTIAAEITPDSPVAQIADALRRAKPIKTPSDLAQAFKDPNPFSRAGALESLFTNDVKLAPYIPLVVKATSDPVTRVRTTALYLLTSVHNDARITPVLQQRLNDPDIKLRGLATVELLKRGLVPPESHLIEVLNGCTQKTYGNFSIGVHSDTGVDLGESTLLPLLAPHATPAIFAMLMQNPPNFDSYDYATTVFPSLGAALRKYPESAAVLLSATDKTGIWEQPRFAHEVFGFADKSVLPVIHKALQSNDPVVRANAASVCERIGNSSSIRPLIRALDLRSNVSLTAIVTALGKLKAQAALPYLAPLYIQARIDEVGFRGSGMRPSYKEVQKHRTSQGQETSLGDVTLRDNWLDIKPITKAILAINPKNARSFGHVLGDVKNASLRSEATVALSSPWPYNEPERRSIDVALLQELLLDQDEGVRMSAAVGLVGWGEVTAQSVVMEWLQAPDEEVKRRILRMLGDLSATQLSFTKPEIQEIANNAKVSDSTRTLARQLLNASASP